MKISLFIIVGIITLVGGCSSIPVSQSYRVSVLNQPDDRTSGYNNPNKVGWLVTNNETHLCIRFDIYNRMHHMMIRRHGLRIYFDTTGSEKQTCYLEYPHVTRASRETVGEGQDETRDLSDELLWKNGEEERVVNTRVEKSEFVTQASVDFLGNVHYSIVVPFTALKPGGLPSIDKLSVGYVLEGMEIQSRGSEQENPTGTTAPAGRQGGGRGGRGAGGASGGEGRGGREGGMRSGPVKIFFEVNLAR